MKKMQVKGKDGRLYNLSIPETEEEWEERRAQILANSMELPIAGTSSSEKEQKSQ